VNLPKLWLTINLLLLALFIGATLAVAEVLVQGIVRNPLTPPDILGIKYWRRLHNP